MKVGIVGSGAVAQDLAAGFLERGDEVMLGSRSPSKLDDWVTEAGDGASAGDMAEAAAFGELVVLAVVGTEAEPAVEASGPGNLAGKVLIDVTNPLVFEEDKAPRLAYGPEDSAGERVQRAAPEAKVVKSFNIVNSGQMVHPEASDPPTMFVAGEDEEAKRTVSSILDDFGWSDVYDLGGIDASRELESLCVLWCRIAIPTGQTHAAFRLLR